MHILAVAPPGSQVDIAPSWLVTEATAHSKAEHQRAERAYGLVVEHVCEAVVELVVMAAEAVGPAATERPLLAPAMLAMAGAADAGGVAAAAAPDEAASPWAALNGGRASPWRPLTRPPPGHSECLTVEYPRKVTSYFIVHIFVVRYDYTYMRPVARDV
jgi:hypothetical protein